MEAVRLIPKNLPGSLDNAKENIKIPEIKSYFYLRTSH